MGTRKDTVAHLMDALPGTSARPMFGEYALYLRGQVVALVCDDRLFVKPLPEALDLLPDAPRAPPHRMTRQAWICADAALDDPDVVLQALVAVAEARAAAPSRGRKAPPTG